MTKTSLSVTSVILTIAVIILIALLIGLILLYGGFNVAATQPHAAITEWVMDTTMTYSVRKRAAGISVPSFNEQMISEAAPDFEEMCQICHGAMGVKRSEISQGLLPQAPLLSVAAEDWKPNEVFWILKHGIKMTGMPAFGPTHPDEKLWNMTAYVMSLPQQESNSEEYLHIESDHTHE